MSSEQVPACVGAELNRMGLLEGTDLEPIPPRASGPMWCLTGSSTPLVWPRCGSATLRRQVIRSSAARSLLSHGVTADEVVITVGEIRRTATACLIWPL